MISKMHADNYDGIISVEFVSAPDVIEAGLEVVFEHIEIVLLLK